MAKKILNIEIGERITKVCVSDAAKKKTQHISQCFMYQTPVGTVSDGFIADPEAVAAALKAELEARALQIREAIFSLVSGRVGTREVTLPPVKENQIKAIVESNAAEYFPVDMSKYHVGYAVQERVEKGERAGVRLLVMIVPLQILESYFELAAMAGLTVRAIDYSGNSLFQVLRRMSDETITMYINVESTTSSIMVLKEGRQLLQRNFTTGVDDLLNAYLNAAGYTREAYITALRELSNKLAAHVLSDDETREALSRLIGNIVRIVDYFNSNNWETPVEKLVLTGSGCDVRGLQDLVARATTLDTTTLEQLEGIKTADNIDEPLAHYLSCFGSGIAPVDFVPEQYVTVKKKGLDLSVDTSQIGLIALVLGVALSAALTGWAVSDYYNARAENQELQARVDELAYVETIYNEYVGYMNYVDGMLTLDMMIYNPNAELVAFIEELEKKMPSAIIVLSASCTTTGVNMNVTVSRKEEAAMVISQLRTFESLGAVQVSGISDSGAGDSGVPLVSFSLSCTYGPNPWLAASE